MSLLGEVLIISGVAMDLVGAAVLPDAHNAESMVEIREEIGTEKSALGVVVVGLVGTAFWVRIRGRKFRREIREAQREGGAGDLPEQ